MNSSLARVLRRLSAIIALGICCSACVHLKSPADSAFSVATPNVAEIGWINSDGKFIALNEYRGRVLVLDFYATWCEPCRQSIPRLIALQQKYESQGLRVVGLNVGGPDDRIKVPAFAAELQIKYPLGFPTKALTDSLLTGDLKLPQTFVFGPDGQLNARYFGGAGSTSDDIDKMIEERLKDTRVVPDNHSKGDSAAR